jgi:ribosome-interacting GTPase 1
MVFGPTQSGKSSLLKSLTNARVEIASYDYSTQYPTPGMLQYEDIQIQLVELPAPPCVVSQGHYEVQPGSASLIRQCDGLIIVVDLSNEPTSQLRLVLSSLEILHISTQKPRTRVEIIPEKGAGEIRIAALGSGYVLSHEQISTMLHSYGIRNALVRIFGNATMNDVEDAILQNVTLYKPTIVIANKLDLDIGRQISSRFLSHATRFSTAVVSCLTRQGLDVVGRKLFDALGIVRVYTKEPNEPKASPNPFVVPEGTTVRELARGIHSDLADEYRYARLWGPTSKFAGERVGPDHVLGDKDIVEIHSG